MMDANSPIQGISCDVGNCYYNKQKECHATAIKVGPQFAASTADTVCDTFRPAE